MSTFRVSFCVVVFFIVNTINGNVIIDTKSGKLTGKEVSSILPNEKYYSFLGIPYAQPPLKNLRFMPPVPHPGWDDILQAKKEKPQCAQYNLPIRNIKEYGYFGNEDCLYLSVHTPRLPTNNDLNLPVIVFFYNEYFRISYNASKDYGPDFLMKENVILVTINHRLGSLGFLSFGDEVLPGNNGIRDVILALKWLKDNVGSFGGDPSKVTLLGHKGGATLVDVLLHSPKAKGLFSAAILQSESSWSSIYFDDNPKKRAIDLSAVLEQKATTSESLLQRLSDVSAFKITESELLSVDADESRINQRGLSPFGPILEIDHPDAVITSLPENITTLNVPVMMGFNSREGIEMCNRYLRSPNYLTFAERDFLVLFPIRVGYRFDMHNNMYRQAVQEIKDFYFDEGYVKISKPGEYITYVGDIVSFYSIDYAVRAYNNISTEPIYYYMFDYSGELNFRKKAILDEAITIDGTWGASLNDDLCYVFVCHPWKKVYKKLLENDDSDDLKVLRNMVKLITNFAKTG